jgi:hypothetical protein
VGSLEAGIRVSDERRGYEATSRLTRLLGSIWSHVSRVACVVVASNSYPLVKTFSSEVFPQAPSPLDAGSCQYIQSRAGNQHEIRRTAGPACAEQFWFHHREACRKANFGRYKEWLNRGQRGEGVVVGGRWFSASAEAGDDGVGVEFVLILEADVQETTLFVQIL